MDEFAPAPGYHIERGRGRRPWDASNDDAAVGLVFDEAFAFEAAEGFADGCLADAEAGGDFFLAWTQGSHPFFFRPSYEVRDGRLVFALVATSSSGSVAGQPQQMKVEGDDNIAALRRGSAFWWDRDPQPEGMLLPLRLIEQR